MKKKIILGIAIIILVALTALVSIYITNNQKEQEEKNKEEFSKNIINPDRIIYKNQEKYYEIKPENEIYKIIIEQMSKKIDTSKKETIISQEELDDMHNQESFIEFDYNTVSKNYILILNNKGKFAKMMDSGAELIKSNIDTNSIKKEIDGKINNTKYYTMDNKEYISKNTLVSVEYKYLQQFKNINNQIYQTVIKDNESLELYTAMCNLEFDEEIPNDVFNNNVIVLTLAIPKDITVKINIGNLRYYYDNKKNNYEYTAHLLIVSKIVNTNCIYNVDNTSIESKAQIQDDNNQYNQTVANIDEEIFVKDFNTYLNTSSENKNITQNEADEIANKAFKQAENIVGQYSKDSQTIETQEVYANNFFTRKANETDKVYNTKKIKCYVYTREDDMLNGVSVYIDVKTGKVIGGRAFGD